MVNEVLLRFADFDDTYLAWTWLDDVESPAHAVLSYDRISSALSLLEGALFPQGDPNVNYLNAIEQALVNGALANPVDERELARVITSTTLPESLQSELVQRIVGGHPDDLLIRITPSRRLAQIPWELLALPDGRRLIEVATVIYDAPSTIHHQRSRLPIPWSSGRRGVPLRMIDPILPRGSSCGQILPWPDNPFAPVNGACPVSDWEISRDLNRKELGEILRSAQVSRLLYYGHVSSNYKEPGSAALHLSDDEKMYGLARTMGSAEPTHRPLCALDFLIGTLSVEEFKPDLVYPAGDRRAGPDIWPMPPRVALIACESGADFHSIETYGLIMAILNAGAECVTSTRWILPSDAAFAAVDPSLQAPTTATVAAVDHAHEANNVTRAVAQWQRKKLAAWNEHGRLSDSPILWASLMTHMAPLRSFNEAAR